LLGVDAPGDAGGVVELVLPPVAPEGDVPVPAGGVELESRGLQALLNAAERTSAETAAMDVIRMAKLPDG